MTTETDTRPDYQPYTDWHCNHHRDEAYAGPVLYVLVDETETTATPLCTDCVQSLLLRFAAQQEAESDRRPRSFEVITVAAYVEALRGLPPIGCPWPGYGEDETGAIAPSETCAQVGFWVLGRGEAGWRRWLRCVSGGLGMPDEGWARSWVAGSAGPLLLARGGSVQASSASARRRL